VCLCVCMTHLRQLGILGLGFGHVPKEGACAGVADAGARRDTAAIKLAGVAGFVALLRQDLTLDTH
jgi:hypothetical protein